MGRRLSSMKKQEELVQKQNIEQCEKDRWNDRKQKPKEEKSKQPQQVDLPLREGHLKRSKEKSCKDKES